MWAARLARPLGLYAASRAVTLLAVGVAAVVSPEYDFKDTLLRWDSGWYLRVAAEGYPEEVPRIDGEAAQSTIAFFPLFPMVVRTVSRVTGLPLDATGLLCATGLGALAAVLLWLLCRKIADAETADRATALFCFFPASFVLTMPYSESLMLAFATGCLLALVSGRWVLAGAAAGLATATRPNAVALVACCAWEAARRLRRQEWRALVAPLLAPAGVLAFFGFLWVRTGDVAAWFRVQRSGWEQEVDYGLTTVRQIWDVARDPLRDINQLIGALSVIFVVVAGFLLLRSRLPSALIVYAAIVVAMAFLSEVTGSRPRFLLTAFPLLIAVAQRAQGLAFAVTLGSSAALLGVLTILSTGTLAATP